MVLDPSLSAGRYVDLIVYDMSSVKEGISGLFTTLDGAGPSPVLVLCERYTPFMIDVARHSGAVGLVAASDGRDIVVDAVRRVVAGAWHFPREGSQARSSEPLSRAQLRVLAALETGRLNKQIADDLGVTEATVKAHLSAAFRVLNVSNRIQALLATRALMDA